MFEKSEVEQFVREKVLTQWHDQFEDIQAVGKLSSLCKITWKSNKIMWQYLKSMSKKRHELDHEGQKISLWHSMDKPESERLSSMKISVGLKMLQGHVSRQGGIAEEAAKELVSADWGTSYMFCWMQGHRVQKVEHKPRN